jgi:hypothetical protein
MGGSHGRSQQFGEEKNNLLLPGIEKQFCGRPESGLSTTSRSFLIADYCFSVFYLNFGFSYCTRFIYLRLFSLNNICLVLQRLGIRVSGSFQFRINDYPIEFLDPSVRAVSGVGLRLLICWCVSNAGGGARMSVSFECCVLSGRGVCDGPIPRPEEYYRVLCVDVEASTVRRPRPTGGCRAKEKKVVAYRITCLKYNQLLLTF